MTPALSFIEFGEHGEQFFWGTQKSGSIGLDNFLGQTCLPHSFGFHLKGVLDTLPEGYQGAAARESVQKNRRIHP